MQPTRGLAPVTDALRGLLERARDRHPDFGLTAEAFAHHMQMRASPQHPIDALHAADLYLACACVHGDPRALVELDRRIVAVACAATRRAGAALDTDEVAQRLRTRLLIADADGAARIAEYAGRGSLEAWLRVAAVRLALNLRRDRRATQTREAPADALAEDLPPVGPDLQILRRRFQPELDAAFREAFRALDQEDRLVLRLYFRDAVSLEGIARMLGASRATAGRRLQTARGELRRRTMRLLTARLGSALPETEHLLDALSSQLELSLGALITTG